ncbi:Spy/CpxP family protein refolding chaperone [Sulfurirhabdus autotrophica]|uniref:Spy/CpxP family protein refolding chaperone n=1 Tax=Sulfurirhabdus autotrophica TaxID=1706046 RepID=A0A4R3Y6N4_9PROT|nr:Spy/CpxP family protein refolding chaperone [Sulfurirhabdus autotrophica]TCV87497.1 Spy/CpxP family protein refolding chaperone [Sulfurirhabdus autotrophica]
MNYQNISRFLLISSMALGVSLPVSANTSTDKNPDCKSRYESHGHHEGFNDEGRSITHHMRNLNLTDEQKSKIKTLEQSNSQAMQEKFKALRETKMEIRKISMSGNYDEAKVKALAESDAKNMAELTVLHARTSNQIYQLLTPEQRKQMEEQRSKFESMQKGKRNPENMKPN